MRLLNALPALLVVLGFTAISSAQSSPPAPRIATVNVAKVFNDMRETTDLKKKITDKTSTLQAESNKRSADLENLRKERDFLKPGSPEFNDKNQDLIKMSVDLRVWTEMQKLEMDRDQKQQMRDLMDKILVAVKNVADQEHVDLVIAEQSVDLPQDLEQITVDQLRAALTSRNILYKGPNAIDLTAKVTAALDAAYLGSAPAAPAPSAPAAPAPADGGAK